MIFLLSALTVAEAAPPAGFKQTDEEQGCVIYKGPTDTAGNERMFADCYWPEVTRWFQATGFIDLVGQMRTAAKP
jgi:hypothetical protein